MIPLPAAAAAPANRGSEPLTDQNSAVKLPQLVQQLRFGLVDGKLFPLDVYGGGRISLSRQQHSRLILIETEKNGPRLESFRRRRVGVVWHGLEKVTLMLKLSGSFLRFFKWEKETKKFFFPAH